MKKYLSIIILGIIVIIITVTRFFRGKDSHDYVLEQADISIKHTGMFLKAHDNFMKYYRLKNSDSMHKYIKLQDSISDRSKHLRDSIEVIKNSIE